MPVSSASLQRFRTGDASPNGIATLRKRAAAEHGSILLEAPSRPVTAAKANAGRSFFFCNPLAWLEARALDELPRLFDEIECALHAGYWVAGYLSYECGYHWEPTAAPGFQPAPGSLPLVAFGIYCEPVNPAPTATLDAPDSKHLRGLSLTIDEAAFTRKVDRIRGLIAAGDTYQVNLTDRVLAGFDGDAAALFARMMEAQPVEFGALLRIGGRCILSASPELFFRRLDREISVRPMKGTARRGRDTAEDAAFARALAADPKNRAENLMIVDLLRNDLGRVAEMGSVHVKQLFSVEQLPTLLQMSSEITARLRPSLTNYQLFASLFPSGSIVGAPKVRTMQILRELETRERGVYTGAIGFIAPDNDRSSGEAVFSVAIRTAVVEGDRLEMGVGAGITWDSGAAAEYAECCLKARFLREPAFQLIETMRWDDGRCALLGRHLDRIEASARYFSFAFERKTVLATLEAYIAGLRGMLTQAGAIRLRMLLARDGSCVLSSQPISEEPPGPQRVMLWPEPVHSSDRFLRHKTTRRAFYDYAYQETQQQGYADAIFRNEHGFVTEGAIHNIFLRHGSTWRTPPLSAGILPGVYRAHLLETMLGIVEAELTLGDLETADEIWLTNAIRGVRQVSVDPGFPATAPSRSPR